MEGKYRRRNFYIKNRMPMFNRDQERRLKTCGSDDWRKEDGGYIRPRTDFPEAPRGTMSKGEEGRCVDTCCGSI